MLAIFNSGSLNKETGLEKLLATKWGVAVGNNVVVDPDKSPRPGELIVSAFSAHPITNPLLLYGIDLMRPRPIGASKSRNQAADAPKVTPLAASSDNSFLQDDPLRKPQAFHVAVAVEKGAIKDVVTERGTTRIVVLGDSFCFANPLLNSETWKNRDFAGYVVNWLLDRPQLLNELGPRPVAEYRLVMTKAQLQSAEWILLAGMPGFVMVLGTLVWFRRRR